MSEIKLFQRLFSYDHWANQQVLSLLPTAPQRSLELLAHIISAERLWWERLQQRTQSFPVWPDFTIEQCGQELGKVSQLWSQCLAGLDVNALRTPVDYKNTTGESFRNTVEDILMHVYTHSAYHRGQIAANIRESGGIPKNTDFIHCIRQGFVE